jgi:hypothetical protein
MNYSNRKGSNVKGAISLDCGKVGALALILALGMVVSSAAEEPSLRDVGGEVIDSLAIGSEELISGDGGSIVTLQEGPEANNTEEFLEDSSYYGDRISGSLESTDGDLIMNLTEAKPEDEWWDNSSYYYGEILEGMVLYPAEMYSPAEMSLLNEPQGSDYCGSCGPEFRRGDVNGDGVVDYSDGDVLYVYVYIVEYIPTIAPSDVDAEISCLDAADVDDDGDVDYDDYLYFAAWQAGGPQPPSPGPYVCGLDPTEDDLTCDVYRSCYLSSGTAVPNGVR